MAKPKIMDPRVFTDEGYLQELNRRFLHPLGLALAISTDPKTKETVFHGILDNRADEIGVTFGPDVINREKMDIIEARFQARLATREQELGWGIQGLDDVVPPAEPTAPAAEASIGVSTGGEPIPVAPLDEVTVGEVPVGADAVSDQLSQGTLKKRVSTTDGAE